ncbi:metal ABC transporter permease [Blastopirellula retiformator]|uniref:Manganese transport system membrane protein MntB n=1 Tax=Blastopirellula retiformator TaxID=2527970 RepID=A0A5C5UUG8_9BACT|nr:iron chelate uptake ABC transporter family permease subunit [Blastopirellula retiformator]TWT29307.1 Manganese transport system membrane protein MntB [Blastopirellula retiformator]
MNFLYDLFVEPLASGGYLLRAMFAGSLVAIASAMIGCFIVLRRMAFLGDAISHSMLAGVVGGYLVMKVIAGEEAHFGAMILGALLSGFVTVLLIGFVSRASRVKDDTAIGIMYTGIFAFGGAMASVFSSEIHVDLMHMVMGDVLVVDSQRLWMMGTVTAIVLFVVILFYRQLQLTSFDPIMAASVGVSATLVGYLLTACTSLVVVSAVSIVGIIQVVGLLITPAAAAYLLCDRLSRMLMLSAALGVSSVVLGIYASAWFNIGAGSSIVMAGTVQFMAILILAPHNGLLAGTIRRWRQAPQHILEDVLGCLRRDETHATRFETIRAYVHAHPSVLRRVLQRMLSLALLDKTPDGYILTEAGQLEARRLMRAHRIWETYLQRVGMPEDSLHDRAHLLEHLNDEATVDYLDDRLGHPIRDPHGQEIPEDFVDLVPGAEVKASLLRDGHRAAVTAILDDLNTDEVAVGDMIVAGPREADDTIWTFHLPNGEQLKLDHDLADLLIVRLADPLQAPPFH